MKKTLVIMIAICTMLAFGLTGKAQATTLGLSLVMDGSGSISSSNWTLQLTAYANAISDPLVVPQDSTVALNVIQFASGVTEHIGFTIIDSQATADSVAAAILGISQFSGGTCISCGIYLGESTLNAFAFGDRRVIDVTTDGGWNVGINPLTAAMDVVDTFGIDAVNSLGIGVAANFNYGTGSFSMTVTDFAAFEDAIKQKIKTEIVGVPEPATLILLGSGIAGLAFARRRMKK